MRYWRSGYLTKVVIAVMAVGSTVCGLACSCVRADEQEPPAPQKASAVASQAVKLVEKLAHDEYDARVDAAKQLADLGAAARQALQAGLRHDDPEVRRQCRRLLAEVMDRDYQQSLAAFIAHSDADPKAPPLSATVSPTPSPPGWAQFRAVVGDDKAARELFIEMHRREGPLLCAMESGGVGAAAALAVRFQQATSTLRAGRLTARKKPDWPTIAVFLFAAADSRLPQTKAPLDQPSARSAFVNSITVNWSTLLRQTSFRKAMSGANTKDHAQKLLGRWVADARYLASDYYRFSFALRHNVAEGLPAALEAVGDKSIRPDHRVYAIHLIGKLGGKPYARYLLPLLEDDGVCRRSVVLRNNQPREEKTTQLRDVALAWLVHHTGQKHADYGMPRAASTFRIVSRMTYISVATMTFSTDKERQAALSRWQAYHEKNPLPMPPGD